MVSAVIVAAPGGAQAGVNSDKSKISQLEQKIESEGSKVEDLVSRYNAVEATMSTIRMEIAKDRVLLSREQREQSSASGRLRAVAVSAYVDAGSGTGMALTSSSSANTLPEQEVYLGVATRTLDSAMVQLQIDRSRTSVTERALHSAELRTSAVLTSLLSSRQAAQAATSADQSLLGHVKGNLASLVDAIARRQAATEAADDEKQLAERNATHTAAAAAVSSAQPTATAAPTPGQYEDPLRGLGGLGAERIDQGVDYRGFGPIYAIGDGVVISTYNGGWPGGTFITYRLTDGPASGLVVYAAEDIDPDVQVGQAVTANTVIGQVYEGSDGIETGWADPSGDGNTMAADYGQYGGSNTTAFGYNFSQLLSTTGAPGGISQGYVSGALPAGWPQW